MKKIFLLAIGIIQSMIVSCQESISNELTADHLAVKGTKVSLVPPDGFIGAANFLGFQQTQSGSSILVLDIPGPFTEVSSAFTDEGLLSQGMVLKDKTELTLNNLPALLLRAEQSARGVTYTKYILAFGSEKESILINAAFPADLVEMDDVVKNSLLSTFYEPDRIIDPFETVDFEISTEGSPLVFAKSVSNSLIFNHDGKVPTESTDKASFIVGKAFYEITVEDKKLFALNRMKQLPIEVDDVIAIEPVEIDEISGYEIVADVKNKTDGAKKRVYQVILYSDNLYYILLGSAESDFENNIESFRNLAKTFKRK